MAAPAGETRCPSCGSRFLAFLRVTPCPGCGAANPGSSDIVAEVLRTYAANVRDYGRPIPPVIHIRSLRDDYLYRALFFLKALDERRATETDEEIMARSLETLGPAADPGWRGHLEAYYREILAARVGGSEREK